MKFIGTPKFEIGYRILCGLAIFLSVILLGSHDRNLTLALPLLLITAFFPKYFATLRLLIGAVLTPVFVISFLREILMAFGFLAALGGFAPLSLLVPFLIVSLHTCIFLASLMLLIKIRPQWQRLVPLTLMTLGIATSAYVVDFGFPAVFSQDSVEGQFSLQNQFFFCANEFAKTHNGEYPKDLAQLGPNGQRCISASNARGFAKVDKRVASLSYSPESQNGHVLHYHLVISSRSSGVVSAIRINEQGVTYQSVQEGKEPSFTNPDTTRELEIYSTLIGCLRKYSRENKMAFPQELSEFGYDKERARTLAGAKTYCAMYWGLGYSNSFLNTGDGYRFTYIPSDCNDGICSNFVFEARPVHYGQACLRSFYVSNDFKVHAVAEDRAATVDDPLAQPDELSWTPERDAAEIKGGS